MDGLTGLIDMPLFHISSIFGYWPLPNIIGELWAIYDSNINITTSLHMLYMSYIRLRSIKSPKNYTREILIKRPVLMMMSFWAVSLTIWLIIVFVIGLNEFSLRVAFDGKTQYVQFVVYFIGWFIPLMLILILSAIIVHFLIQKSRKTDAQRQRLNNGTNIASSNRHTAGSNNVSNNFRNIGSFFRFKPQTTFFIIISTYWLQWTPPCILTFVQNFCNNCIDSNVYDGIYWLTYTVNN